MTSWLADGRITMNGTGGVVYGCVMSICAMSLQGEGLMGEKKSGSVIHSMRRVKIQTRLLITFLLLSLVPVLFVGVFAYQTYTNSINDKLGSSAEQNVRLLNATLNTELERYAFYINSLSVSSVVQQVLTNAASDDFTLDASEVQAIRKVIEDTTIQPAYLRNIIIADSKGNVVHDHTFNDVDAAQYQEQLRHAEEASPGDMLFRMRTFRSVNLLVLGRKIYSYPSADKPIGYIFVYINEKLLSDTIYPDISYGENSQILLVNHEGVVLSSKDSSQLGASIANEDLFTGMQEARALGSTAFNTSYMGENALAVFSYSQTYNCYFVATIPNAYITNETIHITISLVVVAAVMIALCFVATFVVYQSIMQPIRTIVSRCNVVSDEELDREIGDESPDELGFLARTIDRIIAELKGMAYEWQRDQRRKRELELEMLRYQINPHFLFNTLNTLRWVAVMNEVPVLEEGISSLSALLQGTLMREDEFIPIREEISNLQHYFSIQRIRYADSFEVEYKLEEELLDYRVPRFILQPLAENAVIHGTNDGSRKVIITVACRRGENGDIIIEIRDDGAGFGMQDEAVPARERFSGIGLKNVDERLRLHFGTDYGLVVQSAKGEGTVCTVTVPQSWMETEGNRDV